MCIHSSEFLIIRMMSAPLDYLPLGIFLELYEWNHGKAILPA